MTKELYPRPRAKIGDVVVVKYRTIEKYRQCTIVMAFKQGENEWYYNGKSEMKTTMVFTEEVADSDIVENLTTGYKLVNEEWMPPNYKDILRERAELEAMLQQNGYLHPNQLITEEPSVDSFGNPKS